MKVLKFGGTSVGSVNSILNVKKIVESITEPVVVVISALGGITDKLLLTSSLASKGDSAYRHEFSEIVARHRDLINGVVPDECRAETLKHTDAVFEELENIFRGVFLIKDLSAKTSDIIVSYGERLSSYILSRVIRTPRCTIRASSSRPSGISTNISSILKSPTS